MCPVPIFRLGCAGGSSPVACRGVALASPGTRNLFLVVELCALTFPMATTPEQHRRLGAVGDGAARADRDRGRRPGDRRLRPPHLAQLSRRHGLRVEEDGSACCFRDIPTLVRTEFRSALTFLDARACGSATFPG